MRSVTRGLHWGGGRVRGREQQPGRPRDHVQHPVTNGGASRHQGVHRPLNIGLNVLKRETYVQVNIDIVFLYSYDGRVIRF